MAAISGYMENDKAPGEHGGKAVRKTGQRYLSAVLTLAGSVGGQTGPYGDTLDLVLWHDGRYSLVQREYGSSAGRTVVETTLAEPQSQARVSVVRKWADGTVSTEAESHDPVAEHLAGDDNLATITVTTTDGRTAVYDREETA